MSTPTVEQVIIVLLIVGLVSGALAAMFAIAVRMCLEQWGSGAYFYSLFRFSMRARWVALALAVLLLAAAAVVWLVNR